jgi:hypothetical protein
MICTLRYRKSGQVLIHLYPKNFCIYEDQLKPDGSPFFVQEIRLAVLFSADIHFVNAFAIFERGYVGRDLFRRDHWPTGAGDGKDCGTRDRTDRFGGALIAGQSARIHRMHPLHIAIGDSLRSIERPDTEVWLDAACGGQGCQIRLYSSEPVAASSCLAWVDAAIVVDGEIKIVLEIEESNVRPLYLCGKVFATSVGRIFLFGPLPTVLLLVSIACALLFRQKRIAAAA